MTLSVTLRFYEELNDFLPGPRRKRRFAHALHGPGSVKDLVESLGVPHTEIDLILVNGRSVRFTHPVRPGDDIAVYPMFEALDITPLLRLRPKPLRVTRFVLDVHLGRLARYLRLLGFDTLYRNDYTHATLAHLSRLQRRILLTRDRGLLKRRIVTRGCFLRETQAEAQLREVVTRLDLARAARPFSRCVHCNTRLRAARKGELDGRVKPAILRAFARFRACPGCGRVYWPGSHYDRMRQLVARVVPAAAA